MNRLSNMSKGVFHYRMNSKTSPPSFVWKFRGFGGLGRCNIYKENIMWKLLWAYDFMVNSLLIELVQAAGVALQLKIWTERRYLQQKFAVQPSPKLQPPGQINTIIQGPRRIGFGIQISVFVMKTWRMHSVGTSSISASISLKMKYQHRSNLPWLR